MIKGSSF